MILHVNCKEEELTELLVTFQTYVWFIHESEKYNDKE